MKNHTLIDLHPMEESVRQMVLNGLSDPEKKIPSKLLYDQIGSELFEAITRTPEYYQTRSEMGLLHQIGREVDEWFKNSITLVELGSGDSRKVEILLTAMGDRVRGSVYMPVDISKEYLNQASLAVAEKFPELSVVAVCADFLQLRELPRTSLQPEKTVVFFPGSTIGNFEPKTARGILDNFARLVGPGGGLLIGADLKKQAHILNRAYNDAQGITAQFELNILERLNRTLNANFDKSTFYYEGYYNPQAGRVEMYIVSKISQKALVDGVEFSFRPEEKIHLENSYKWTNEEFVQFCAGSGFQWKKTWTDQLFSVFYMEQESGIG